MGIGKTFGIGFLIFIILNLIFAIIATIMMGGDILDMFLNPNSLILNLLGAIGTTPTMSFLMIFSYSMYGTAIGTIGLGFLIISIGSFIAPAISAIIIGKLSENKVEAFLTWFAIAMISAITFSIMSITQISQIMSTSVVPLFSGGGDQFIIVTIFILFGLINAIFYGCFATLSTKSTRKRQSYLTQSKY